MDRNEGMLFTSKARPRQNVPAAAESSPQDCLQTFMGAPTCTPQCSPHSLSVQDPTAQAVQAERPHGTNLHCHHQHPNTELFQLDSFPAPSALIPAEIHPDSRGTPRACIAPATHEAHSWMMLTAGLFLTSHYFYSFFICQALDISVQSPINHCVDGNCPRTQMKL